jgi:hypothetical protein
MKPVGGWDELAADLVDGEVEQAVVVTVSSGQLGLEARDHDGHEHEQQGDADEGELDDGEVVLDLVDVTQAVVHLGLLWRGSIETM